MEAGEDAKASQVGPVKKKRGRIIRDIEAREIKVEIEPGEVTGKVVIKVRRSNKNGSHRATVEIRGARATISKIESK